jgi:hypothetical protein
LERERLLFHSLTNLGDGPQQEEEEEKFFDLFSFVCRWVSEAWAMDDDRGTEIWGGRETEVHALRFGACAPKQEEHTARQLKERRKFSQ